MTSETKNTGHEFHVRVERDGTTAVELLQAASNLPRQRIKSAMTKGAVWITRGKKTQRLRRATRALRTADELHLYYNEDVLEEKPPEAVLIADEGEYSVWNKPRGMWSQGSKWGDHCTLARWAERNLKPQRTAFTVHRLDKAANGLMLIAHSRKAAAALSEMFRERRIEKRYVAKVVGEFVATEDVVRVESELDGKVAISEFELREYDSEQNLSLIDVRIETGRKHQIRRHLESIGFPIVGDRLYGGASDDGPDLQLTAISLAFNCPVNNSQMSFSIMEDQVY